MKKTLVLMALAAGVACADQNSADAKRDLLYYRLSPSDTQDFTLTYTISRAVGGDIMTLADDYKMVSQGGNYIGLKLGSKDPGNNKNYDIASGSEDGSLIMTPQASSGDNYVNGWVTCNSGKGSEALVNNSAGTQITVKSSSEGTSSVKLVGTKSGNGGTINNTAQNTAAFNLSDISMGPSLTSITGFALEAETPDVVSGQHLTTTIGGNGYMAETAFNFAVMSAEDAVDGSVIAVYGNQAVGHYNYFTLTEVEGLVYFTASMGTHDDNGYHLYDKNPAERTVTLSGAPIEIGHEYTAVIIGESDKQYVYLYDDQATLLASGSYNGNMDGNLNDSGALFTYENPTYAAPEPATATLSLLALAGLMARRRRH